jgi:hypothetical protein
MDEEESENKRKPNSHRKDDKMNWLFPLPFEANDGVSHSYRSKPKLKENNRYGSGDVENKRGSLMDKLSSRSFQLFRKDDSYKIKKSEYFEDDLPSEKEALKSFLEEKEELYEGTPESSFLSFADDDVSDEKVGYNNNRQRFKRRKALAKYITFKKKDINYSEGESLDQNEKDFVTGELKKEKIMKFEKKFSLFWNIILSILSFITVFLMQYKTGFTITQKSTKNLVSTSLV